MGYSRYKGRVSGVVGLSCARHMFTLPCGTVDITGGERYVVYSLIAVSGQADFIQFRLPRLLHVRRIASVVVS